VTFKFSFPLLSFVQWTQWHTLMIHRLFSQGFDWLKTDRILGVVFKPVYLTSLILVPISCSNLWLDRKFEASALTLFDIRLTLNYLQFPTLFFRWYPNIRTFIYCCTSNCVNTNCFIFGKKCDSASDRLLTALYIYTVKCSSYIKWITGFILYTLYS